MKKAMNVKLEIDEAEFWADIERRASGGERVDAHRERAARMFGVPVAEVTQEQRRAGKAENYVRMYSVPWFQLPDAGLVAP